MRDGFPESRPRLPVLGSPNPDETPAWEPYHARMPNFQAKQRPFVYGRPHLDAGERLPASGSCDHGAHSTPSTLDVLE